MIAIRFGNQDDDGGDDDLDDDDHYDDCAVANHGEVDEHCGAMVTMLIIPPTLVLMLTMMIAAPCPIPIVAEIIRPRFARPRLFPNNIKEKQRYV